MGEFLKDKKQISSRYKKKIREQLKVQVPYLVPDEGVLHHRVGTLLSAAPHMIHPMNQRIEKYS